MSVALRQRRLAAGTAPAALSRPSLDVMMRDAAAVASVEWVIACVGADLADTVAAALRANEQWLVSAFQRSVETLAQGVVAAAMEAA